MCEPKREWNTIAHLIELISSRMEELARRIRLTSGTINESRAVKIEANKYVRICCERAKDGVWQAAENDARLSMDIAPPFVSDHLERLVVDLIGPYGDVEVVLARGRVTDLNIHISRLPTGRNRK